MDRPRRNVRPTAKVAQALVAEPKVAVRVVKPKATAEPLDPQKQLKTLLESTKSDLVSLEMQEIINADTWSALPEDACRRLEALLPPTAFIGARETIGADHPSVLEDPDSMVVDADEGGPVEDRVVNPSFFNDPHFLAAARTFQDHLYLGWFTDAHRAKVKQFQEGIIAGTMAAPWKDEVWIRDNGVPVPQPTPSSSFTFPSDSGARAGGAGEIKLSVLVKNGIIRVGDVIAYKRYFTLSDVTVEKDCIIDDIQPKTYALTVLTVSGPNKDLPAHFLSSSPTSEPAATSSSSSSPPPRMQSMTITSPTMLETGLLELDGRIDKSTRPNGNAWKNFTIWRWRQGTEYNPYDARGGRENHGTLFYLRGSYYHER